MSQEEISGLLKREYPRAIDYKEIMEIIRISKRSVLRNLKAMRSREEIEYSMQLINGLWVRTYRERRETIIKPITIEKNKHMEETWEKRK
jgi:hypothetical protein